ncbi:MAG: LytTR family DNA-binding domain-containing protein [Candidatus Krumholzibacteria bacterium]|nr:LytTR family DNA-binding domain-containing protein [Candidatus Krumholzibacteria bacterium]
MTSEPVKVLVVDDEKPARRELTRLVGRIDGFEVAGEAGDGEKAVESIRRLAPDIVLLDIQMPGLDGFRVLASLGEDDPHPAVIFVTAWDQYAVRAFEVHAVDYLLKPVDEERLRASLARAAGEAAGAGPSGDLGELLRGVGVVPVRVPVLHGGKVVVVDAMEILYAAVSDGEVTVVTAGIEGVSPRRTLDELQQDLPAAVFMRVHRSYLANIMKISEIVPRGGGAWSLRMGPRDGPVIPLSRQHARELRKVLGW